MQVLSCSWGKTGLTWQLDQETTWISNWNEKVKPREDKTTEAFYWVWKPGKEVLMWSRRHKESSISKLLIFQSLIWLWTPFESHIFRKMKRRNSKGNSRNLIKYSNQNPSTYHIKGLVSSFKLVKRVIWSMNDASWDSQFEDDLLIILVNTGLHVTKGPQEG